jgi:hypothetical protein
VQGIELKTRRAQDLWRIFEGLEEEKIKGVKNLRFLTSLGGYHGRGHDTGSDLGGFCPYESLLL